MATEHPPASITIGDNILQFEEDKLGEEYEEKARNELRETPDIVKSAMEKFRSIVENDENINFPVDEPRMMYQFLRPCKFYPESAYEKMKSYYSLKYNNPKYYVNLLPSTVENAITQDILTVLPLRSQHGRRILYMEVAKWDVRKVTLPELIRCILLLVEIALTEYRTQISGVHVIFDLKGLCLQHVCQFGPSIASLMLQWIQECVPLRLKGVHIVNQPYLFGVIYSFFKPFFNHKIRNRIYFHGRDYESLYIHIDKKFLPSELGGELQLKPFDRCEFHRLLCSHESEFEHFTRESLWQDIDPLE